MVSLESLAARAVENSERKLTTIVLVILSILVGIYYGIMSLIWPRVQVLLPAEYRVPTLLALLALPVPIILIPKALFSVLNIITFIIVGLGRASVSGITYLHNVPMAVPVRFETGQVRVLRFIECEDIRRYFRNYLTVYNAWTLSTRLSALNLPELVKNVFNWLVYWFFSQILEEVPTCLQKCWIRRTEHFDDRHVVLERICLESFQWNPEEARGSVSLGFYLLKVPRSKVEEALKPPEHCRIPLRWKVVSFNIRFSIGIMRLPHGFIQGLVSSLLDFMPRMNPYLPERIKQHLSSVAQRLRSNGLDIAILLVGVKVEQTFYRFPHSPLLKSQESSVNLLAIDKAAEIDAALFTLLERLSVVRIDLEKQLPKQILEECLRAEGVPVDLAEDLYDAILLIKMLGKYYSEVAYSA